MGSVKCLQEKREWQWTVCFHYIFFYTCLVILVYLIYCALFCFFISKLYKVLIYFPLLSVTTILTIFRSFCYLLLLYYFWFLQISFSNFRNFNLVFICIFHFFQQISSLCYLYSFFCHCFLSFFVCVLWNNILTYMVIFSYF